MTTDQLLDRLHLCNAEIPGIVRALRMQPTKPILPGDLPLIYVRPFGMVQDAPRTSAGQYVIYRRYMLVIMVGVTTMVSLDTSAEGSALLARVAPFLDAPVDYYMNHPHLHTEAGLGEMGFVDDVKVIDAGPELFTGPDGVNYAGIRPIITIAERRFSKRLS